jgi:hypothetical protein
LNWRIKVLQTSALPLGYAALNRCLSVGRLWSERRDLNSRQPPWQGGALPTELLSHTNLVIKDSILLLQESIVDNIYIS